MIFPSNAATLKACFKQKVKPKRQQAKKQALRVAALEWASHPIKKTKRFISRLLEGLLIALIIALLPKFFSNLEKNHAPDFTPTSDYGYPESSSKKLIPVSPEKPPLSARRPGQGWGPEKGPKMAK